MTTIDGLIVANDIHVQVGPESGGLRAVVLSSRHHRAPLNMMVPADLGTARDAIVRALTLDSWEVLTAMSLADWANDQGFDSADPGVRDRFERISTNAEGVYLIYGGKSSFEHQAMSL
ncbi:hypothetical protein MUG78_16800 [Gordonia alkaliphila]|uniref:hypothetical protein n=1 Tax=Gordonia alkaliphila TaxID=1053547 RepID=UPI001FF62A72|nr:hypothetical protein [Gordonia alkaliphila]MCK0441060.1 hypothetical protein [Gordonia alkaliphila]